MGEANDPWGGVVRFDNPQEKGAFADPLQNRAAHLIGEDKSGTENRVLKTDKLDWIGATRRTIEDAQVRVIQGNEVLYFRSYNEGIHLVVVESGAVKNQYGLVTQYAPELRKTQFRGAIVERVRREPGLAPQGGPGSVGLPAQAPDSNGTDASPRSAKEK